MLLGNKVFFIVIVIVIKVFNPGLTKRGSFLTPSLQIWGSFGKSVCVCVGKKLYKNSSDRVKFVMFYDICDPN